MKLGIIGTGAMAEALIKGFVAPTSKKKILSKKDIYGFDVSSSRLKFIQKKYGIQASAKAVDVLKRADIVILAVKPQQMGELLAEIKEGVQPRHLVVSIAAGLDTVYFKQNLGNDKKIVRTMPNSPATIGLGITAYYAGKEIPKADTKKIEDLFNCVGETVKVDKEDEMDAVTALSGSGPAFVHTFLQGLMEGGEKIGLDYETASKLAIATILGSTQLFKQMDEPISSLIQKVASKGGTTEAGLAILQKKRLTQIVEECLKAATKRARELRGVKG